MHQKKILDSLSKKVQEHEFYTPVPKEYKVGRTKYIITFGTVMSGLGKGIFSSCLGKLIQDCGVVCSPVKFDGYLNQDAGTLNPYRHGEVFVLDDGTECDMDLGTYERFFDKSLSKDNYLTGGKIFNSVLDKERKGGYLGRDVQIIPHVTGEIKGFLRNLAVKTNADVILVEVGGTVGDFENMYFIEAMRELAYEEGKQNVCFVCLTYVLEPGFLGEQKSKAAQLGLKALLSLGIQPDIVACRATNPVTEKVREKISIYSNVPFERVVSLHDVNSVYTIPLALKGAKIDQIVLDSLGLKEKVDKRKEVNNFKRWQNFIRGVTKPQKKVIIGVTGKYTGLRDSYASIINAIEHAAAFHNVRAEIKWIETTDIEKGKKTIDGELKGIDGVIVPGGFGARGAEGKIMCIKYLREKNIPYLGLCYGFQMALVEFARNVCKISGANSTEVDTKTKNPVVDYLPEQLKKEGLGGNMRLGGRNIEVKKDTMAYKIYGNKTVIRERFRHRWECNPKYIKIFEKHGIVFSGKAPNQPIMQILELPSHPFFVGVQFHPEFTSRPLCPNPLYVAFIKAILGRRV